MKKYSSDENTLMLLSLLKQYDIKKIIASPGTTNIAIVGSMQHDPFFEIYSSVDERSAGYIACGMAAESGTPVAIICTGATASRNYYPALTEAYYRKLPILVIAGSHGEEYIGHLHSQVIDRTTSPKDTFIYKAFINPICNKTIRWKNNVNINSALIALRRKGGGPVLINIVASARKTFIIDDLPNERIIRSTNLAAAMPPIPSGKKIAVFIASHKEMTFDETCAIDAFCEVNNSVVFCDHTSGYYGKYGINSSLICSQYFYKSELFNPDILIHVGEVSGDTYTTSMLKPREVWRISEDGKVVDFFKTLSWVFEMTEYDFFRYYCRDANQLEMSYYEDCLNIYNKFYSSIPKLYFGNIYIAKTLSSQLPQKSIIHFAIFNSLRSWNFFSMDKSIKSYCNVGGFGIDGAISTAIGSSLVDLTRINYLVIGDLAFFYDLNSLGNRHIGNNLRILLINNGCGVEFRKKDHIGSSFGEDANKYIAAGGHFGEQSKLLVQNYVTNLGFEYMSASSKEEFDGLIKTFISPNCNRKPLLLEVFPSVCDEVQNLELIRNIYLSNESKFKQIKCNTEKEVKKIIKKIVNREA